MSSAGSKRAPPHTAAAAGEGITAERDELGRNLAPFGPGTPITITASGRYAAVGIYVARAVDLRYRPTDYDFVKVGKAPLEFVLPPGENYILEVESPEVTRGSLLLRVDSEPKRIEVAPGRAGLHDLGTLSLAAGLTAVLGGAIVYASGTKNQGDFKESVVAIPLLAVGGVGVGLGSIAYATSRTRVTEVSGGLESARAPGRRTRGRF